ncbi:MAG: TAT-variant-translocated molybdopterin oxidoreductase [Phycisphaerales bacterium]
MKITNHKSQITNPPTGPAYWRSLDELADTPDFRGFVEKEFPGYAPELMLSGTRRTFLKLMGASAALAGLVGCRRWPQRKLAPYTSRPENRTPGVPQFYATALELDGIAQPLLVKAYDGRPVKIEGNPDHPASGGAASLLAQASILNLYDPQRSRAVKRNGTDATWADAEAAMKQIIADAKAGGGAGLVVLTEPTGSPTVERLKATLLKQLPGAKWATYSAMGAHSSVGGARPIYSLSEAKVIVALDCDFLGDHPEQVRLMRQFADSRRTVDTKKTCSRLYVAEPCFTITGTNADVRMAMRRSRIGELASAIAAKLGISGAEAAKDDVIAKRAARITDDLKRAASGGGKTVVMAGAAQPAAVHALVAAINAKLGGPVRYVRVDESDDVPATARTLIVLGGNPLYDGSPDVVKLVESAKTVVHLSHDVNDTSATPGSKTTWHLPRAHDLEAWGDARTADGQVVLIQPLIYPLFGGRSMIELLALLTGENTDAHEQVRKTFAGNEKQWRKSLHDGFIENTAYAPAEPPAFTGFKSQITNPKSQIELVFRRDYKVLDGRFANNGWLQELPEPLSKLTWGNAAVIGLNDADKLGVKFGDVIRITLGAASAELPVYVLPGQPDGSIAVTLGYGRKHVGHIGENVGVDVYPLWRAAQTSGGGASFAGAHIERTGKHIKPACTQDHFAIDPVGQKTREQRATHELIRSATLDEFKRRPDFATADAEGEKVHLPLAGIATGRGGQPYENPLDEAGKPVDYAWGMTIDLNACTGCNACVIACQSENNIPIVGSPQVLMNREMHWLRIDRYFAGDPRKEDDVRAIHQPMMCQQCENAPCEQVCPVAATTHDTEGLNVMVYNRCIGTRYCSNNCPYKVRRFNFFDFNSRDPKTPGDTPPYPGIPDQQPLEQVGPLARMKNNPDVTVRMRGVMEKCTFCTQRIQIAKQDAAAAGRKVAGDEIQTACQQTCPAKAISFGNLKDSTAPVHEQYYTNERGYSILEDFNTRPRTRYLAKVTNPTET